jgi:hypothetical protein
MESLRKHMCSMLFEILVLFIFNIFLYAAINHLKTTARHVCLAFYLMMCASELIKNNDLGSWWERMMHSICANYAGQWSYCSCVIDGIV